MIKIVAFDWNGTIVADTAAMLYADNIIFEIFGYKPITLKRMREAFDIPISKFWDNLGFDSTTFTRFVEKERHTFYSAYLKKTEKCRTRAGAVPLLRWLSEEKIKSVIFSNHSTDDIEKHLRRLKAKKYFDAVMARHQDDHSHVHERNKEQKLLHFLHKHHIKPHEVVCIGDTCEEVDIAKQHGMVSISITGGNVSTRRLRSCKPNYLINNLAQVKKIIKELNTQLY